MPTLRQADFRGRPASPDARRIADWVARSGDNGRRPFVILDKRDATVYVFDPAAGLVGESPVLLGFAPGDDSAEGIGQRALEQVRAHEKTTPAGRFEGERGHDTTGEDVVWVDYDTSVAMHRVRVVDPTERRLERLKSPDPADRRISFGCINVPVAFFERVVAPVFKRSHAAVYVLPETKSLTAVTGAAAAWAADERDGAAGRAGGSTSARMAAPIKSPWRTPDAASDRPPTVRTATAAPVLPTRGQFRSGLAGRSAGIGEGSDGAPPVAALPSAGVTVFELAL